MINHPDIEYNATGLGTLDVYP